MTRKQFQKLAIVRADQRVDQVTCFGTYWAIELKDGFEFEWGSTVFTHEDINEVLACINHIEDGELDLILTNNDWS